MIDQRTSFRCLAYSLALILGLGACCGGLTAEKPGEPGAATQDHADGSAAADRRHGVFNAIAASYPPEPYDGAPQMGKFDFQKQSPMEYLNFLKGGHLPSRIAPWSGDARPPAMYTIWGVHRGWLRAEDIDGLLTMLDDPTPCIATVSSKSSFRPGASTVGREAALLVGSYRGELNKEGYGGFPVALSASSVASADELRAWWQRHQKVVGQ